MVVCREVSFQRTDAPVLGGNIAEKGWRRSSVDTQPRVANIGVE